MQTSQEPNPNRLLIALVVLLSLVALLFSALSAGFSFDNTLVYQGF